MSYGYIYFFLQHNSKAIFWIIYLPSISSKIYFKLIQLIFFKKKKTNYLKGQLFGPALQFVPHKHMIPNFWHNLKRANPFVFFTTQPFQRSNFKYISSQMLIFFSLLSFFSYCSFFFKIYIYNIHIILELYCSLVKLIYIYSFQSLNITLNRS